MEKRAEGRTSKRTNPLRCQQMKKNEAEKEASVRKRSPEDGALLRGKQTNVRDCREAKYDNDKRVVGTTKLLGLLQFPEEARCLIKSGREVSGKGEGREIC